MQIKLYGKCDKIPSKRSEHLVQQKVQQKSATKSATTSGTKSA